MSDVIHNPVTDWCACEPNGDERCDYRLLADTVIAAFNPPDDDRAEVSVCIDAVMVAADAVAAMECYCSADGAPCTRCRALGQWQGRPVSR